MKKFGGYPLIVNGPQTNYLLEKPEFFYVVFNGRLGKLRARMTRRIVCPICIVISIFESTKKLIPLFSYYSAFIHFS